MLFTTVSDHELGNLVSSSTHRGWQSPLCPFIQAYTYDSFFCSLYTFQTSHFFTASELCSESYLRVVPAELWSPRTSAFKAFLPSTVSPTLVVTSARCFLWHVVFVFAKSAQVSTTSKDYLDGKAEVQHARKQISKNMQITNHTRSRSSSHYLQAYFIWGVKNDLFPLLQRH